MLGHLCTFLLCLKVVQYLFEFSTDTTDLGSHFRGLIVRKMKPHLHDFRQFLDGGHDYLIKFRRLLRWPRLFRRLHEEGRRAVKTDKSACE